MGLSEALVIADKELVLPKAVRRRARDESGFTLVELLVTIAVLGFVMTAILGLLDTSAKVVPKDAERATAIGEAQAGLDRMVRDLRQAYRIESWSGSAVQMRVNILRDDSGTTAPDYDNVIVDYDCGSLGAGRCVRREAQVGSSLPAEGETVVDRVLNGAADVPVSRQVFNFDQTSDRSVGTAALDPVYVTVRIEVPAAGERGAGGYQHSVVLEDGFYARNVALAR